LLTPPPQKKTYTSKTSVWYDGGYGSNDDVIEQGLCK
jgi:hypothetical protein